MSHTLALIVGVALTAVGQVLLKLGARGSQSLTSSLRAMPTIAGYLSFGVVTLLMPYAMLRHDLATVTAYSSVAQVLVLALSRVWLGEQVNRGQLAGVCLIVAGVASYSL